MKTQSQTQQLEKKPFFQFLPGPIKIKDGLFIGDQIAARDIEFIITNKVTHIVNTVSKQIPNLWERFGIHYLSVSWSEKEQNIFDKKNNAVNTIFHFVEEAMEQGQSCLIHSINGKSRSCAVLVAYLIKKYALSLNKCLEYISAKKLNLNIRNNFLIQMQQLEQRMMQIYNLSTQWSQYNSEDELLLKNTYVNSKKNTEFYKTNVTQKKGKRVTWGEKSITVNKAIQDKSLSSFKQKTKYEVNLKSVLRGQPNPQSKLIMTGYKEDFGQFQQFEQEGGGLINNIKGNLVHLTVNNFITSQKKPEGQSKTVVNTRPYSSDQKDRQRDLRIINQKIALPQSLFDTKFGGSFRNGSQNKSIFKNGQQEKDFKGSNIGYERPQSAKKNRNIGIPTRGKQQLIITNGFTNIYNSNKQNYPTNSKEEIFKRK